MKTAKISTLALLCVFTGCYDNSELNYNAPILEASVDIKAANKMRPVHIALNFDTEQTRLKTSACLEILEYPKGMRRSNYTDRVLNFIATAKSTETQKLIKLIKPSPSCNYKDQAKAIIDQFSYLELLKIEHIFALKNTAAVILRLKKDDEQVLAPLFFDTNKNNFLYLPCLSEDINRVLLRDLFQGKEVHYCRQKLVQNATHKFPLSAQQNTKESDIYLLIEGHAIKPQKRLASPWKSIEKVMSNLSKATRSPADIPLLSTCMTPVGAAQLTNWWPTATAQEQSYYINQLRAQKAFFLFNADPLFILYTRSDNQIQTMYFTTHESQTLWTNSAHMTTADKIFKQGVFMSSAAEDPAFVSKEIR